MIITEKKPFDEILQNIKNLGARRVLVVGCGSCATLAQTGGEKQVEEMKQKLSDYGIEVAGTTVIETACHERLAVKALKELPTDADAVVVLSCGSGVQNLSDVSAAPVVPGLNTLFIGKTKRPGEFVEYCSACGHCILGETGGICVKTRCPKGILNGPCGGMVNRMCEVNLDSSCVWVEVWERTKGSGLKKIRNSSFRNERPGVKNGNHTRK